MDKKYKQMKKKGGKMTLMSAFTASVWQEVQDVVSAFLVIYRAEVI